MSCPICYDEITQNTGNTTMACSHSFHLKCIVSWLYISDSCPCCRRPTTKYENLSDESDRFEWYTPVPELQLPPNIFREHLDASILSVEVSDDLIQPLSPSDSYVALNQLES